MAVLAWQFPQVLSELDLFQVYRPQHSVSIIIMCITLSPVLRITEVKFPHKKYD